MECPSKWTFVAVIIFLSFHDNVSCQNLAAEGNTGNVRDNRDCYARQLGNSVSTDKLNSILTVAAPNRVPPDLKPILQGQPCVDNIQKLTYSSDILTNPLSVFPTQTSACGNTQESIILSTKQIRPSTSNVIRATSLPCGSSCPSNMIPVTPQTILPSALTPPSSNCISQIAQALPQENYPLCAAQNVGTVRPTPIVLQPQYQFNEVNPYNFYNQIAEPISLSEITAQPLNLPILPPPQILPGINTCSGALEIASELVSPCISPPMVFASDSQQLPLNLQINVPPPTVQTPRITVVSANPSNSPTPPSYFPDYSQSSPIVIKGSTSKLRNLLPILLLTLLSDNGYNYNGGECCSCCCSCNGNSGNNIFIPYPIPIPINNPILNTCQSPYCSRYREYRDDDDEDEDCKRK